MSAQWLEAMVGLVFSLPFGYAIGWAMDWYEDHFVKEEET